MKIICIILTIIIAISIIPVSCAELYANTAMVINYNAQNCIVTCIDFDGNIWEFCDPETWELQDIISLLMDDCDTENVEDDIILEYSYHGNISFLYQFALYR